MPENENVNPQTQTGHPVMDAVIDRLDKPPGNISIPVSKPHPAPEVKAGVMPTTHEQFEESATEAEQAAAALGLVSGRTEPTVFIDEDAGKDPYVRHFQGATIDIYRVCDLWGITQPAVQHAIKKLLRRGRADKTPKQDIEEAIKSLQRAAEMMEEDAEPESQQEETEKRRS